MAKRQCNYAPVAISNILQRNATVPPSGRPLSWKNFGPLLDRIAMQIEVPFMPQEELMHQRTIDEKSSIIRARLIESHQRQINRQERTNSRLNLSARVYHPILKVARTIADYLSGTKKINITTLPKQFNTIDWIKVRISNF